MSRAKSSSLSTSETQKRRHKCVSNLVSIDFEKLVQLIRRQAKEVAYEVIDEHLEEYEHKEKTPDQTDVEG